MVDLITESRVAIHEPIDGLGRAKLETILVVSAERRRGRGRQKEVTVPGGPTESQVDANPPVGDPYAWGCDA
jgi:hypothetical protein